MDSTFFRADQAVDALLRSNPDLAIGLWFRLANDLLAAQRPLTVDGDDLVCPHCGHHHLYGRDLQGREWDTNFLWIEYDDGTVKVEPSDQGFGDAHALYYECGECAKGVRLPDGVPVKFVP